jgi:beta-glucosidase
MTARVDMLLGALSLEQKVSLLAGEDMWHLPAVDEPAVPALKMTDGPIGARGKDATGGPPSACFPCGTALGATWDVDLVRRVGGALGAEVRAKQAHVLLGPTVNIHRHPLAGRNFECYSEDPLLSAEIAAAYVAGVQSTGVAACVKHFVANDADVDRFTIDCVVDERTLREIYLLPFETALLRSGAWSVMGAYNRTNGDYCCESPWLLTTLLRDDWRWDGVVVSDWLATHSTAPALAAGLDIEMPGPTQHRGKLLLDAIANGEASETDVDRAVARVLLLAERTGALDGVGAGRPEGYDDAPERRALLREAAAAGTVLLRNDGVLPLEPSAVRSVAVIGPNADAAFEVMGGGSAEVTLPYLVTPLEGLRAALERGGAHVAYELGCPPATELNRLDMRHLDGGAFAVTLTDDHGAVATNDTRRSLFRWGTEVRSARITGTYRPADTGMFMFELRGAGRMRLLVDGRTIVDGWERGDGPPTGEVELLEGVGHELLLEYEAPPDPVWMTGVQLRVRPPLHDDMLERAVAAAAAAEVAIVVVGLTTELDAEGQDRPDMSLPAGQDALVHAVAAANARTVVVVNAGSPVAMPWIDNVAAVALVWCPGQEGGNGVADVLTGATDPGGRLPTTLPARLEDTPSAANYPGTEGRMEYKEGVFVGYRGYEQNGVVPLFPFGHGLSYTAFEYGALTIDGRDVSIDVTNVGPRGGSEVVQLYVGDVDASVPRPPKELKAFTKLRLDPGASGTARFTLDDRAFAFWADGHWQVEPGDFVVSVGASSADIRARASITIP